MVASQPSFVLSYGAGVNSTALMILLLKQHQPLDYVVFADTGGELPETYQYLVKAQAYLTKHSIPFVVVRSRNGSLFDTCVRRRVIPSQIWRWSTRDYKITPIYKFYRSLGTHVCQYVGIAYDEVDRMRDSRADYVTNLDPLVDAKVDRKGCEQIILEEGLPVPVRSGCFFCPFSTVDHWHWLQQTHPDLFAKAMILEESSKFWPKQRLAKKGLRVLDQSWKKEEHIFEKQEVVPCGGECMT